MCDASVFRPSTERLGREFLELRLTIWYLRIFGVCIHPTSCPLKGKTTLSARFHTLFKYGRRAVASGSLVWVFIYLISYWRTLFHVIDLCQYMRVILNTVNAVGHLYAFYLLARHETRLADIVMVNLRRTRTRTVIVATLTTMAFVLPMLRGALSVLREILDPMSYSGVRTGTIVLFTPLRIVWHFSLLLSLFAQLGAFDMVQDFESRMQRSREMTRAPIDIDKLSKEAVLFKAELRQRIQHINTVFSFVVMHIYFKIFKTFLVTMSLMVVRRGAPDVIAWCVPMVHYTIEIAVISSASTLLISGSQSCTDTAFRLIQETDQGQRVDCLASDKVAYLEPGRDCARLDVPSCGSCSNCSASTRSSPGVKRATLFDSRRSSSVSELKRVLDFDEKRDAVTIFDAFVLRRSTTMTFFAGMVPCISIILQFDYKFNRGLGLEDE